MEMTRRGACVFITNSLGEVLAVSRKDIPTAFGLPGGKVNEGETYKEAAIRETKEETGLDVYDLVKVYSRISKGLADYNVVTFTAKCKSFSLLGSQSETGVVAWVKPEILLAGPFGEHNKDLLDAIGFPRKQS